MSAVNLALWLAGVLLIAFGTIQARAPWRRYQALQAQRENADRYAGWRGGRHARPEAHGQSGADVMRDMLRRRLQLWGLVVGLGVVLVFLGFLIR